MPFLCLVRSDIQDAVIQVLDLEPNTSQRNLIIDPPGQTKYVNRVRNDRVSLSGAGPITTDAKYVGLAAYLVDNVEDADNAGIALTAARANAIASALIARMDAGGSLDLATVNGIIQASTGGATSTLSGGNSTGTLAGLLAVMAGAPYTLPAGSRVETAGNLFDTIVRGSVPPGTFRHTYESGALTISLAEGDLSVFTNALFDYDGTLGPAVVVYNDDGSVRS